MNERFVYMPSAAFCILAGWFLARKLPEWFKENPDRPTILAAGLMVAVAAFFGWRTFTRVPDWKDKLSLNTSAVKVSPNSARAQCFYAVALYEERYKNMKDPAQRLALLDTIDSHLTRALQINPKYSSAWQMLPGVSGGRFDAQLDLQRAQGGAGPQMDRLFNDFDKALENAPYNVHIRKYVEEYVVYLAKSGGNPNKIMAFCYRQGYERFFKQLKDPQMAIRLMEAGLKTQWLDERLYNGLAEAYEAIGNSAKAAEMRQKAEQAKNTPSQ
jgi:tetratricopeptide (TPR) repeat protein